MAHRFPIACYEHDRGQPPGWLQALEVALFVALHALLVVVLVAAREAEAQPVCPPPPEPTSARSWDLPAGCPAPFDLRAYTVLGYLKTEGDAWRWRAQEAAGAPAARSRTLPPWAWALIAGAGALLAPPLTCKVGEACSDTAELSAAGVAGLGALGAAWLVED